MAMDMGPEQIVLDILREAGVNITDPTAVRCDICSDPETTNTKGGYVLLERKDSPGNVMGRFTYECDSCYAQVTLATPEERAKCTGYRGVAVRHKIGINPLDPSDTFRMDPAKTFRENVITFKSVVRAENGHTNWRIQVERRRGQSSQSEVPSDQSFRRMCRACKKDEPCDVMKRCGRCHMAYYCSSECQKKDWRGHRKDCDVVAATASRPI